MSDTPSDTVGMVWLIGAGPGDPGLFTVAGQQALAQADVVVYDALANPRLYESLPEHVQRIDVGKRAKAHKRTQDETNALMVELAQQGKRVARLKGGDPYLFGRGAEEAAYCAKHGVRAVVIPGVTSGIAAPAYAGIPVTHRKTASCLTFVTGHEDPTKGETALDYGALAALIAKGGTVCFYMGVGRLPAIVQTLTGHGLDANTPAAAVQWGTLPKQRAVKAPLKALHDAVMEKGIGAPAILVVGPVAGLDEPGLDFFTDRPLFGQRIVVTRTRLQASVLREQLEALGAEVLEAPTIRIESPSPEQLQRLDTAIQALPQQAEWLVLTSGNAVEALAERLDSLGLDARHLAGVKIAVIGEATAAQLKNTLGLRADLLPERSVGEAVAEAILAESAGLPRCVLLRADIARPGLPKRLIEAGCEVTEVVAYETKPVEALPDAVLDAFRRGAVDWVTFTSSSTAANLVALLADDAEGLAAAGRASIGPTTSKTLASLGYPATLEAETSDVPGLVRALLDHCLEGVCG